MTVGAGALALAFLAATPARADLFGGDLPLLSGILAQAIAEVVQLGQMVSSMVEEIRLLETQLHPLDPRSFTELEGWLRGATVDTGALLRQIQSMGYTLSSVNAQYETIYPRDASTIGFSQYQAMYGAWSGEVLASAQVASRSQTMVSSLEDSTSRAVGILSSSQGASGEVAQLQAIVQMLGVVHTDLSAVVQTLATTGRVLSDAAAGGASERQLSLEKKKRNLANYTNRGALVAVPSGMP